MHRCRTLAPCTLAVLASLGCSPAEPPRAALPPPVAPVAPAPAAPPPEAPEPEGEEPADATASPGPRVYYRFVDAAGSLHLVDSLSAVPAAERGRAKRIVLADPRPRATDAAPPGPAAPSPYARLARAGETTAPAPAADVVIYTARWCGWCQQALAHLDARGVAYRNRDIDADPGASRDLRRLTGGTSIPVLEIGGELVRGFDVARIDALLDAHR